MCAPVASTSRARVWHRKLRSASTSICAQNAGSRSRARVCSPTVYGPSVAPISAPVPDSAATIQRTCGNAPSRVAFEGRPKCSAFASSRARRWWSRPWTPPAARSRTPRPRRRRPNPDGAGDLVEQHVQRVGPQPGPRPRQRGDVRWPPPPPVTGLDPAVRVEHPAEQLLAAAAVIQRVHQLDHDPPVAAVRAPEQPQREHEIDDQPSGQQPATQLPGVGGGHYPVHQLRRERPGQRANRYPVGQPPLR